jgi:hypothetical protein
LCALPSDAVNIEPAESGEQARFRGRAARATIFHASSIQPKFERRILILEL